MQLLSCKPLSIVYGYSSSYRVSCTMRITMLCDTTSPTPARLNVDKERTAQVVGKRKRFFNSAWLDQFKWLVLCNTTTKGYCHICRYAIRNNLPSFSKCGVTAIGFTNWKKGKEKFATHQQLEFHRECLLKTTQLKNAPSVDTQVTDNLKKPPKLRRDRLLDCFLNKSIK